jgi:hypothetical protein
MQIALRQGFVGLAVVLGSLSPLACSGTVGGVTGGEPTGEDRSLLKEGACLGESLGDATSCKPIELWKEYAAQACDTRGLSLNELSLGAECKDGYSGVKYACCKVAPKELPNKEAGPSAGACFGDAQGGPTSCKPAEVWTKYASELCAGKGAQITHIAFAEECDKGAFRWTKYECCDGKDVPPPVNEAVACKTTLLGGDKGCASNAVWKERAFDACTAEKLTLADLSLDQACGPEGSSSAKVTCCAATSEPPPPVKEPFPTKYPEQEPQPQECTGHNLTGECQDFAVWKKLASEACAQEGLTLTSFDGGGICAEASASAVKFSCCK